jgi:hypothetical protein
MAMGSPMLGVVREEFACVEGWRRIAIVVAATARAAARTRSSRIADMQQKRDNRGLIRCREGGGAIPCETRGDLDRWGTWGKDAGIQNLFIVKNII